MRHDRRRPSRATLRPYFMLTPCPCAMKISKPSPDEIRQRLQAVEAAIASQRLEGLTVSEETAHNLRRAAHGEITSDECIELIRKKYGLQKSVES